MQQHDINKTNCGIAGWYIDQHICDELIDFFNTKEHEHELGKTGGDNGHMQNPEYKDSTDLAVGQYGRDYPVSKYLEYLAEACNHYQDLYEYSSKGHGLWKIVEGYNIQRYKPGQGFHAWHFEKNGLKYSHRHLVWMTYLNTISEGGETEWLHQNIKIKPEKGLTVLWPADWWFTHRGCVSNTETKYIITGWYNYYQAASNFLASSICSGFNFLISAAREFISTGAAPPGAAVS